ncbi:hypothetical protein AC579_8295 [Pseudocercospora musae]|uniref:NmrA-like domain-containing protein n=1 Tax=Pseudocercospora musae TaxID=113226 RepID=A0A139HQX7_9PEZI|nr:hypothetical protein AC579_8295 [Pseudocercospora musae]KXT04837.1 hypothetical protein AC579_8295 [Pseudocercospora musae]
MSEILAITCPSGKQCAHLLPRLSEQGRFQLRLAAHTTRSATKLREKYPRAEVMAIDLSKFDDCRRLVHGAAAINAILPSLHSREKEIGFNLIDAAVAEAKRPGNVFKHFVLSSVLCTQHRALLQHDLKSYVEERLFLSPLDYTILKPTNFMDVYPVKQLAQDNDPVLETRWDPAHPNSLIALADLSDATVKVLNERERHYYAEYGLCSTMPISEDGVAEVISRAVGKTVRTKYPGLEASARALQTFLFAGSASSGDDRPDLVLDTIERLIMYYNRRGLRGNPNVLRLLLGREPTTIDEWVQKQLG